MNELVIEMQEDAACIATNNLEKIGAVATITVRILKHKKPPNKRLPYKVICRDDTGEMALVFFHANEEYLLNKLPEGELRVVSGQVDSFGTEIQMSHPDHIVSKCIVKTSIRS